MAKSVQELTAAQLSAAIEKADAAHSLIIDEMIDAGRGHEKPTETIKRDDPLSQRMRESFERFSVLHGERDRRMTYHGNLKPIRRGNPGGRKKIYATAAEKQAAYRERYAVIDVRLRKDTVETLNSVALSRDIPRNELINQLIQFALANRDWHTAPTFTKFLPHVGWRGRENPGE